MEKNNSENKPYHTQRNNKLKSNGSNVTSMIANLSVGAFAVEWEELRSIFVNLKVLYEG